MASPGVPYFGGTPGHGGRCGSEDAELAGDGELPGVAGHLGARLFRGRPLGGPAEERAGVGAYPRHGFSGRPDLMVRAPAR